MARNKHGGNEGFSLNILFGIIKLPDTDSYWSKDKALSISCVQRVSPRERLNQWTQYLHVNNNENATPRGHYNHDKLFKIRPLLEAVNRNFLKGY